MAVAGADLPDNYWPPADVESGNVGVPLHIFIDLRNMRLYGRVAGAWEMKLFRPVLEDLATAPSWTGTWTREFDFDCGTGTEVEPNTLGVSPEDGTTLPFNMSATGCEPDIGDGAMLDEDDIDLGTLTAGTLLQVTSASGASSAYYPFFEALRINAAGTSIEWSTMGPSFMDPGTVQRQWIIDTTGHYAIAAIDGRLMAGSFYGDATTPPADQCCEGGPTYTYDITVSTPTLATTGAPLAVNTPFHATLDSGDLDVYEFAAIGGTAYTFDLVSDDFATMDPYMYVYNPATSAVIGFNDDVDYAGGDYDSQVTWNPGADTTVWVVAAYWGAWFNGTPGYTITVAD